jgi:hypothetical protein
MKRITLLLSLTVPLFGQEVVMWSPSMGHAYQNGQYSAFAKNPSGTSAVTTFSINASGRIEATIAVSNSSDTAIDFFPGDCTMLLESKSKPLPRLDPQSLANWILRRDSVSLALARFNALNLGNPTYGDQRRAAEAWQNIRNWEASIQREAQSVLDRAFRTETIFPGQTIAGVVYFQIDKTCYRRGGCPVTLRVPVGKTIYEFPGQ